MGLNLSLNNKTQIYFVEYIGGYYNEVKSIMVEAFSKSEVEGIFKIRMNSYCRIINIFTIKEYSEKNITDIFDKWKVEQGLL